MRHGEAEHNVRNVYSSNRNINHLTENGKAQVLETADQELKSYEAKLEALQLQKKGLMQQLLTGKIRVNVK